MSERRVVSLRCLGLLATACAVGCGGTIDGDVAPPDAGVVADGGARAADAGPSPDAAPPVGDPHEPAPALEPLSDDAIAALATRLRAILARPALAGTTHSIRIVDTETGQEIFASNEDRALKPASNTKLFTTAFALETLEETHRMTTRVVAEGAPDASGRVAGDLHVVAEHEVSWASYFHSPSFPVGQLARAIAARGVRSVGGRVVLRGEVVFGGSSIGYYDAAAHRADALAALRDAFAARGIAVAGGFAHEAGFAAPPGGAEILAWRSLPLSTIVSAINVPSHNELADALLRHLGWSMGGTSSYAAGSTVRSEWLASTAAGIADTALVDGSGLSHDNRTSARDLIALYRFVDETPVAEVFWRSLAIAGARGTLASRLGGPDTAGRFFGKTGTLRDTIALSGYLFHRHDGRRYAFAALVNDVTSQTGTRDALDAMVAALADDLRGTGPRPPSPVLASVVNDGTGSSITITWRPVEGADAYLVWSSDDGARWRRERARLVRPSGEPLRHVMASLAEGATVHVRVSAVRGGLESDPSDAYSTRVTASTATVLIVDGNDRWQAEPTGDNALGGGHASVVRYAEALASDVAFDSAANEEIAEGRVDLSPYSLVIWSLGEEGEEHETFDAGEQAVVRAYLDGGGRMIASGSELAFDLVARGTADDASFSSEVLGVTFVADDADTFAFAAADALATASLAPLLTFQSPDAIVANFPDVLAPEGSAEVVLEYVGGRGGAAAIVASGRVATAGFPLESIDSADDRAAVLAALMSRLAP